MHITFNDGTGYSEKHESFPPPGIKLYHMSDRLSCVGGRIPEILFQVKDKIESGNTEDILYVSVEVDDLDTVPRFVQALLGRKKNT